MQDSRRLPPNRLDVKYLGILHFQQEASFQHPSVHRQKTMKSEHRHDLETNVLARQLAELINRLKPHASTISTVALIVAGLVVAGMYFNKSMAARQHEAWDAYNLAIEDPRRDALDDLKQAAEQNAGTAMAELAQVTWADGKVMQASRLFISRRTIADENLAKAEATYQSLVKSASSTTIRDRAHFGLGRVYEMRNEIEKAREHYGAVVGGFAEMAQERAEHLAQERTVETCGWLASAAPVVRASPGVPGTTPEFKADEFGMSDSADDENLLGNLLDDMVPEGDGGERYGLNLDTSGEPEETEDQSSEEADNAEEAEPESTDDGAASTEASEPEAETDADVTEAEDSQSEEPSGEDS